MIRSAWVSFTRFPAICATSRIKQFQLQPGLRDGFFYVEAVAVSHTEMGYLVLVLVLKYIFYVLVLVLVLGCDVLVPIKKFLNC